MCVRFPFLRIAVFLFILIGAACVTQAPAEDGENTEEVEETEEEEDIVYEMEAITVTGSRIKNDENLTPAPVVVLSRDEIKVRGLASIGDVLQTLTVQSNAINTQANNGGDGSTRISLRGLGSHRTLVLLNGRRFVPGGTGANSSVDLNAIPVSAVERVEVLKDGASAVYGSDAVGGVVNIITRSETEGLEIEFYQGASGEGDGESLDISVTAGLKSEKGSVLFFGRLSQPEARLDRQPALQYGGQDVRLGKERRHLRHQRQFGHPRWPHHRPNGRARQRGVAGPGCGCR